MRHIPVYKAEAQLGLADRIRTSARIVYANKVELVQENPDSQKKIQELSKGLEHLRTHATNEGQIDLHYIKSILATVGWNKNDDVFDKVETWVARATPEDKPFNYEHNARDIIGHITSNYVIDFDGKPLADELTIDELPDTFHIATSGVLYKFWPEADLMERMKNIIAEIAQAKWFVSMEALFDNFDYAVVGRDGKNQVIARNEESAFLTKHLRAYGGSGVYEGNKVGRLLRNIVFSGKGLVRRPANPYSDIFDAVATFDKAVASSVKEFTTVKATMGYELSDRQTSNEERNRMAADVNQTQLELLDKENKRLEQTLSAAVAAQKDAEKRLTEMNEKAVKAKIDGLTEEVKARDEKVASLTTQVQTEQKARTEAEAKVAELDKKNKELQESIAKAQAEGKKVARIATITTELALSGADAQKFYDEEVADLNLSDDRFTKLVATFKKNKGTPTAPPPAKTDETQNTQAGDKVIQNAQPTTDKTAPTGGAGVSNNVEQTRAGLANFLSKNYLHRAPAKKNEE